MPKIIMLILLLFFEMARAAAGEFSINDWASKAFGVEVHSSSASGFISTDDLLRLRDLGALALSPDGKWLAFSVRQAVPERNSYVVRWFIEPTDGSSEPQVIDIDGGQPIPLYSSGLPQAYIPPDPAQWSPDGKYIALRRQSEHRVELWIANVEVRHATRVADGEAQVSAFGWSSEGRLIFRTGLNFGRYWSSVQTEAAHGWLMNERVVLYTGSSVPIPPDCGKTPDAPGCDVSTLAYDINIASTRAATPGEAAALLHQEAGFRAVSADGFVASEDLEDPSKSRAYYPLRRVRATVPGAKRCSDRSCVGSYFKGLGWARGGRSIWFLKSEDSLNDLGGAPKDASALYEWDPSTKNPRPIARGTDLIEDCHVFDATAFCERETLQKPRHIISISFDTGKMTVLGDPNPQFATKIFPKVVEARLRDFVGNPGYAHVVYPNNYKAGTRYPLVIVQYRSRGFPRGGTGNEYPIYPLAAAGFAVLSVDETSDYRSDRDLDASSADRLDYSDDLRGRRRLLGSVSAEIDELVNSGLVDNDRVAITGLSAGAEVVHFALQRSRRFAAAIASSGSQDETFLALAPEGSFRDDLMAMFQAKSLKPKEGSPLALLSWSRMPEKLITPLLINVGDREALIGFEGIAALKFAKRPIEVRVFPDEMHIKYHPITYEGIYDNNMMWLKFWLQGVENSSPEFREQYQRWEAMRVHLGAEGKRP